MEELRHFRTELQLLKGQVQCLQRRGKRLRIALNPRDMPAAGMRRVEGLGTRYGKADYAF